DRQRLPRPGQSVEARASHAPAPLTKALSRRPRRIPSRRHSPESPQTRQADPNAHAGNGLRNVAIATAPSSRHAKTRLLQRNPPRADVRKAPLGRHKKLRVAEQPEGDPT